MVVIGVDPGLGGAIAVLDAHGTLEALADTPTLTLRVSRGTRQAYDVPGMVELLKSYAGHQCHVFIEESQPMPGQGTRSMFTHHTRRPRAGTGYTIHTQTLFYADPRRARGPGRMRRHAMAIVYYLRHRRGAPRTMSFV